MGDMYLMQIVATLQGSKPPCSGAPERDVVRAMRDNGTSEALAQYFIDQAVRVGALQRSRCRC